MDNQIKQIKVNGTQTFMGINIPVIEGGFGEGCKCVTVNTVAEIHKKPLKEINQSINRLIKRSRFVENIDYIDMFSNDSLKVTASYLGFITSNGQKQCYMLSERGYTKLAKYMDDDKSWDVMEHFIDEYFSMRETIQNTLSTIDLAMLKVVTAKNKQDAMLALQEYNEKIVYPLQETIEKQKPMVGLAEMRIDKKGCYSLTDVTKSLRLKRGQITKWAKTNGYLHKTLQEVNNKGDEYFKVYSTDGVHNQIGITESGLEYINSHIDEITDKSARV